MSKHRNHQADIELLKQLRRKNLSPWAERKLITKLKRVMPHYIREAADAGCLRWLNELQERTICRQREELADMRLQRTTIEKSELQPATKFLGNTTFEQWRHMASEFLELTWELIKGNYSKASLEITDLQVSGATMQAILGCDAEDRRILRRRVNVKNEARGYFG